jgi:hypothetical protein
MNWQLYLQIAGAVAVLCTALGTLLQLIAKIPGMPPVVASIATRILGLGFELGQLLGKTVAVGLVLACTACVQAKAVAPDAITFSACVAADAVAGKTVAQIFADCSQYGQRTLDDVLNELANSPLASVKASQACAEAHARGKR